MHESINIVILGVGTVGKVVAAALLQVYLSCIRQQISARHPQV